MVIATFVGGSEEGFVKLMNKKAQFLGMNNTLFKNPHGLDENTENYSTAYDMAKLSCYANKIPFYREVTSTKYYNIKTDIKSYSWINRNKMVFNYPSFVSGKTGYTPKAGKTFLSTRKNNSFMLTIVSLNDSDYYSNHQKIYKQMFDKYQKVLIVSKDSFNHEHKDYYIKNDIYYPLTIEEKDSLNIKFVINEKSNIYKIVLYLYNQNIYEEEVYKKSDNYNMKNSINILKKAMKLIGKIF